MRGDRLWLFLLLISINANESVSSAPNNKTERAIKNRSRSQSPWRLVICLSHSQSPSRNDVQRAWEAARIESSQSELEVSYIEGRMTPMTDSMSYPLALVNKFCTDIENGKTVLSIVIGGGSASRFLITAADSINLPALWLPMTHRDFLRQGKRGTFETRVGTSSEEAGAAAGALMHKANWHAFILLIDTTLLPMHHLLHKDRDVLIPRTVVHLPATDTSLKIRLRRISEEGGTGAVIVMACDLNNARRILSAASKYHMLNGRFLWLWLDLKAELRPNEPSLLSSHVIYGSLASGKGEVESIVRHGNLVLDDEAHTPSVGDPPHLEFSWNRRNQLRKREDRGFSFDDDDEARLGDKSLNSKTFMPVGMLALRPASIKMSGNDAILARMLRETSQALDSTFINMASTSKFREAQVKELFVPTCFEDRAKGVDIKKNVSRTLTRRLRESMAQLSHDKAEFQLLNLQAIQFPGNKTQLRWTKVGTIRGGKEVRLDTITWPGGGIVPAYLEQGGEQIGMPVYKIVTALAPPFTMITNLQDGLCLRGLVCRKGDVQKCCYGFSIDLLSLVARELSFRFDLYIAQDGLFGKRNGRNGTWNGIVGELIHAKAQLAFAPLSVSAIRAEVIDYTTPYFFSGVSFLASPKLNEEIPLLMFLHPFSTDLWVTIFISLNVTALAVAIYEWFSPFGLNPWGRQRSKNFSIASALWVMWGLLCGHLVAFKAPKSWPNKFLINIWGGFSVIFVASYTANIAALIAGFFFHPSVRNYHDRSLLSQKVGAPRASVAEYYVQRANHQLWTHMLRFSLSDVAEGVERLRNGSLDILIADTPILDYYRATDNGCTLQKIGDTMNEDTYAVALTKGHPLKESISKVIANYSSNGMLDVLRDKWYAGLPCIRGHEGMKPGLDVAGMQPHPLGVRSVAGVFCLLGVGIILGAIILAGEHLFYKYTLPRLRHCPKTSIWRSRNVMFFSQKLYRFINCVDLVSPHHAAKELMHTVRQGQIASLFQKSVKREHEQRRRRKSKAQFFEMIQEIRRVQQEEKEESNKKETTKKEDKCSKERARSRSKSPLMPRSPRERGEKSRSSTNLSGSRHGLSPVSMEAPMKPREFTLSSTNLRARSPLETVGRRLSHGDGGSPPPRLSTAYFGGSATLRPSAPIKADSISGGLPTPRYARSPAKRGQSFPVFATLRPPPPPPTTAHPSYKSPHLSPNNELGAAIGRKLSREWASGSLELSKSSEAIATMSTFMSPYQESSLTVNSPTEPKNTPPHEDLGAKRPVRRARSHENRDLSKIIDTPSSRVAQPSIGGKSLSERTKKQLESELKAILTARQHHRDLHPP
ncbi:uncharacterized protein [Fopius arisanus]|uniref:Uncharacterized protein isoform X2 n=1 Tax=Fopius arisanus TaxID=64838 RepID=A0A9R1U689_9HYME|nr:PREDICTED: uncharacterized protein LOC105270643 isoform X2 [Fopius arisanus]